MSEAMRNLYLPLLLTVLLSGCASLGQGPGMDAEAWYRRGNQLVEQDRWEEAVEAYRAALAQAPEHARARHNLALVHLQLGVVNLLEARRQLPAVDAEAAATMRYLACLMESFMGHPTPPTCEESPITP